MSSLVSAPSTAAARGPVAELLVARIYLRDRVTQFAGGHPKFYRSAAVRGQRRWHRDADRAQLERIFLSLA
jgi:uncharacterized membrane protein YdjX (TVP38/TMEM64 family)